MVELLFGDVSFKDIKNSEYAALRYVSELFSFP